MYFSKLLFCLALLLAVVSASECQTKLDSFKSRVEAMSAYIVPAESTTPPMGDDMGKRKKRAEGDLPTNCLNITETLTEPTTVIVNCESHLCIGAIVDIVKEFEGTLFGEECSPAAVPDFTIGERERTIMATLRTLPKCNKCVVTYTYFTKLEATLQTAKCFPTGEGYTCDADCLGDLAIYHGYWNTMMQGVCHKNNPGGCGMDGGVTEGEIWDIIDTLHVPMRRIETALPLCLDGCETKVKEWFGKWTPLIEGGCLSADNVDLTKINLIMAEYKLDQQCNEECKGKVDAVGLEYALLPPKCKVGMVDVHESALVNSVNPSRCEQGGSGFMEEMTLAKGFFALTVLGVGAIVIYLVSVTIYNRVVKGKKSYLPSFSFGKSSRSGSKSSPAKRRRNVEDDDEEEVVLYDADMDDDRL